jgi:hypothetical protein
MVAPPPEASPKKVIELCSTSRSRDAQCAGSLFGAMVASGFRNELKMIG